MQRIAFRLMLSSCVCVCVYVCVRVCVLCVFVCVYAAFVDGRQTVWGTDVDIVYIARNNTVHNPYTVRKWLKSDYKFQDGGQNGSREVL